MDEKKIPSREEIQEALCCRHTKAVQSVLDQAEAAVCGLGGLGSHIAVALARLGVGRLHLIDFDRVDLSNLNRQHYLIPHIGMYKTEALGSQLRDINPYLDIRTDTVKMTEDNILELLEHDRIVCEAFDVPEAKAMLINALAGCTDKTVVSASGMAGFESSNDIITRKITERLYLCGDGHSATAPGCGLMAPRVALCAAHQANMVLRLILGEREA